MAKVTLQAAHHDPEPAVRLEQAANVLLAASLRSHGRGEYPFHSERWLRARHDRETQSGATTPPPDSARTQRFGRLLDLLIAETDMPATHRRIVQLVRQGVSLTTIARRSGRPLSTVHRWLHIGLRRMRRQAKRLLAQTGDDELIAQVYREQVFAPLYRDEHHCLAGRESCRQDGLCRHRWYLYGGCADE